MKKSINLLFILLLVQLGLSAWVHTGSSGLEAFEASESLLGIPFEDIDGIEISSKTEKVKLSLVDGKWVLPEKDNFLLISAKLDLLKEKVFDVKRPFPVAITKSSAKVFKVNEEDFERKLVFKKGDTVLKELYLGTSPSFKSIHARIGGEDQVYSIKASSFEFVTNVNDWLDKTVLSINRDQIAKIEIKDLVIESVEGKFTLAGLTATEKVRESETNNIVAKATKMEFVELLGKEYDLKGKEKLLSYKINTFDDQVFTVDIYPLDDPEHFVVYSSKVPFYLKVARLYVEPLQKLTREMLVESKPVEAAPENVTSGSQVSEMPQAPAATEGLVETEEGAQ